MGQNTITVMLTCYNRKAHTVGCLKSLVEGNPEISFRFIVTDDNSTDGTAEALGQLPYEIVLLQGDGQLYWNGGMHRALAYALEQAQKTDYYMLVNDDVTFFENSIQELLQRYKSCNNPSNSVIVGATADEQGKTSYGGILLKSRFFAKFELVTPSVELIECDSFNGNCVLMTSDVFFKVGNVDPLYRHSMSDFDYGMGMKRQGIQIYNSEKHIGFCVDNDIAGSWRDTTLTRKERLQKKESPKGLPRRDWFHFIRKNYGLISAMYHSITPYIRIVIGK